MSLITLAETSQKLAKTTSRLEKIAVLDTYLRSLSAHDMALGIHYLSGELPQGRIGVGGAWLYEVSRTPPAFMPSLALADVDLAFSEISGLSGMGSQNARKRRLEELFKLATNIEQDFLLRLLAGEVRHGALQGIMLEAIAKASGLTPAEIRRAAMVSGNLSQVAEAACFGDGNLQAFAVTSMKPVRPMLAQTANDVEEALRCLTTAAFEYKMDGARVQVHKSGPQVKVFSRALHDVTAAVPEVVELVQSIACRNFILDGEVIALKADGSPHPFQLTMRRFGRKLDIESLRATLPLSVYFFDCLLFNDADLTAFTAEQRWGVMAEHLPAEVLIPRVITDDGTRAEAFLAEALAIGHEGVMAKAPASLYEAGNRGANWLKIKATETLDLVVLAAEWGNGRRQGWLSNLHLGALDAATGEFVMLGKTFKGMTDEMLAWQTKKFRELEVSSDGYTVYLRPEIVVEIAFNNIQASTQYPGGLSLRFARVKRYRLDKTAAEADTMDAVRNIFTRSSITEQASSRAKEL